MGEATYFNHALGVPASIQYSKWRGKLERTLINEIADIAVIFGALEWSACCQEKKERVGGVDFDATRSVDISTK